jgi:hypothetical protein
MGGHDFLHANRQAGNLRAQACGDVVHLGTRGNLANTLLLNLMPGSRCGFCWADCVHDNASNDITGSLAYQPKHTVDATDCQCCCVTWQVMYTVDDVWADSWFPKRLQSPEATAENKKNHDEITVMICLTLAVAVHDRDVLQTLLLAAFEL